MLDAKIPSPISINELPLSTGADLAPADQMSQKAPRFAVLQTTGAVALATTGAVALATTEAVVEIPSDVGSPRMATLVRRLHVKKLELGCGMNKDGSVCT